MESRTFYCPTCGQGVVIMPGQSVNCMRCGRQVVPRANFKFAPAGGGIAMVSDGAAFPLPALRRGTPAIVVALLLYLFFPVGLFLLWTHPVWTDKQKWKYTIVWLSAYMGLILLGAMIFLAAGLMSANL